MRHHPFIDVGLDKRIIDQRAKDSHSVEIDGDSRFCGKRFLLKTRLYGDKRCLYCGRWFSWTETDCLAAMRGGYVDPHDLDTVATPVHCNSAHCQEYHHLSELARQDRERIEEARCVQLFGRLQARGLVA